MIEFDLDGTFHADAEERGETRVGGIYHTVRNNVGGSVSTPVARYFVWRPAYVEGFNPHWRIDCFVRKHKLSGDPQKMAELLATNLQRIGVCALPIWVSWHESSEIGGESIGDLWEEG